MRQHRSNPDTDEYPNAFAQPHAYPDADSDAYPNAYPNAKTLPDLRSRTYRILIYARYDFGSLRFHRNAFVGRQGAGRGWRGCEPQGAGQC